MNKVDRLLYSLNNLITELDSVENTLLKLSKSFLHNKDYDKAQECYKKLIRISELKIRLRKAKLNLNFNCLN